MLDILNYTPLIITILLLEALLSVDNVAVLATITNKLPKHQQAKAVKYGILGAFVFRGISLFFASWLISNPSVSIGFKLLGGLYLVHLGYKGLTPEQDSIEEGEVGWIEQKLSFLNLFWRTVLVIELMDLVFSLDNILAAVGMAENVDGVYQTWFGTFDKSLVIVWIAVFLGIITMRFVTVMFLKVLDWCPDIAKYAMVVIMLLGGKLITSAFCTLPFMVNTSFAHIMEDHQTDFIFSFFMLGIFFIPVVVKIYQQLFKK